MAQEGPLRQNSPSSIITNKRKPLVLFIYIANISRHLYIVTILDLYGQFEPSPWQLLQLGFFSLRFHFGKSPPLSINPKSTEWAAVDVAMFGLARTHSKSATKKPPEGGYLV